MNEIAFKGLTLKAKKELHRVGWFPERTVDVTQVKADFAYWEYHWNNTAGAFLKSFWGVSPGCDEFDFISKEV